MFSPMSRNVQHGHEKARDYRYANNAGRLVVHSASPVASPNSVARLTVNFKVPG